MQETIQKKVELVLIKKGLSKAALGRMLGGISGQRIGHYLSGKRKPKQDFYDKWEKAFGYSLLDDDDDDKKKNSDKDIPDSGLQRLLMDKDAIIEMWKRNDENQRKMIAYLEGEIARLKSTLIPKEKPQLR